MNTSETDPGGGLASRIREARLAAGLSQRELAARVDVTVQTVRGWEAGRWKPTSEHRLGIAEHCEMDVLELEEREAPARRKGSPVRGAVPREERMRAVIGVIARYMAEHGYPPSMRDMMTEAGFSSLSVVRFWLDRCEGAGLIVRSRGMARAVKLTAAGRTFAETPSETGSLPVRREEKAPRAPRAAAPPDSTALRPLPASTDPRPSPVLRLPEDGPRPAKRTTTARRAGPGDGIGARVRAARRAEELTQRELAELVGVSPHTVWYWEAGRVKPTYEHRLAIAFHCGTDVGALEGRTSSERERIEEAVAAFPECCRPPPQEGHRVDLDVHPLQALAAPQAGQVARRLGRPPGSRLPAPGTPPAGLTRDHSVSASRLRGSFRLPSLIPCRRPVLTKQECSR